MNQEKVTFNQFKSLGLKIGEVVEVSDIDDYDKLYRLVIDLGEERRVLVAGLKNSYQKEELEGLQLVIVTNLEPKVIAGIKSEGMLLAADSEQGPALVMPCRKLTPGTKVR